MDINERDTLIGYGWVDEGIGYLHFGGFDYLYIGTGGIQEDIVSICIEEQQMFQKIIMKFLLIITTNGMIFQ